MICFIDTWQLSLHWVMRGMTCWQSDSDSDTCSLSLHWVMRDVTCWQSDNDSDTCSLSLHWVMRDVTCWQCDSDSDTCSFMSAVVEMFCSSRITFQRTPERVILLFVSAKYHVKPGSHYVACSVFRSVNPALHFFLCCKLRLLWNCNVCYVL